MADHVQQSIQLLAPDSGGVLWALFQRHADAKASDDEPVMSMAGLRQFCRDAGILYPSESDPPVSGVAGELPSIFEEFAKVANLLREDAGTAAQPTLSFATFPSVVARLSACAFGPDVGARQAFMRERLRPLAASPHPAEDHSPKTLSKSKSFFMIEHATGSAVGGAFPPQPFTPMSPGSKRLLRRMQTRDHIETSSSGTRVLWEDASADSSFFRGRGSPPPSVPSGHWPGMTRASSMAKLSAGLSSVAIDTPKRTKKELSPVPADSKDEEGRKLTRKTSSVIRGERLFHMARAAQRRKQDVQEELEHRDRSQANIPKVAPASQILALRRCARELRPFAVRAGGWDAGVSLAQLATVLGHLGYLGLQASTGDSHGTSTEEDRAEALACIWETAIAAVFSLQRELTEGVAGLLRETAREAVLSTDDVPADHELDPDTLAILTTAESTAMAEAAETLASREDGISIRLPCTPVGVAELFPRLYLRLPKEVTQECTELVLGVSGSTVANEMKRIARRWGVRAREQALMVGAAHPTAEDDARAGRDLEARDEAERAEERDAVASSGDGEVPWWAVLLSVGCSHLGARAVPTGWLLAEVLGMECDALERARQTPDAEEDAAVPLPTPPPPVPPPTSRLPISSIKTDNEWVRHAWFPGVPGFMLRLETLVQTSEEAEPTWLEIVAPIGLLQQASVMSDTAVIDPELPALVLVPNSTDKASSTSRANALRVLAEAMEHFAPASITCVPTASEGDSLSEALRRVRQRWMASRGQVRKRKSIHASKSQMFKPELSLKSLRMATRAAQLVAPGVSREDLLLSFGEEQRRRRAKKKSLREAQELRECTFQPNIRASQTSFLHSSAASAVAAAATAAPASPLEEAGLPDSESAVVLQARANAQRRTASRLHRDWERLQQKRAEARKMQILSEREAEEAECTFAPVMHTTTPSKEAVDESASTGPPVSSGKAPRLPRGYNAFIARMQEGLARKAEEQEAWRRLEQKGQAFERPAERDERGYLRAHSPEMRVKKRAAVRDEAKYSRPSTAVPSRPKVDPVRAAAERSAKAAASLTPHLPWWQRAPIAEWVRTAKQLHESGVVLDAGALSIPPPGPVVCVDLALGQGLAERIPLWPSSDVAKVAAAVCRTHSLDSTTATRLKQWLESERAAADS
jgi:hypothetical protein